jgi:predicted permease
VGDLRSIAFRKVLISSQVAFSLVLLIAAGMFVRVLSELRPVAYQANPKSILLFTLKPQPEIYTRERSRLLAAELIRRTSQIPGVEAAGLAENGPLGSRSGSVQLQVLGGTPVETYADWVSPGFLDTIGVARVGGRDFSAADQPGTTLVAIVNQALARQMFPNQNPIGRTLVLPATRASPTRAFEIVGLVADTVYYDIRKPVLPMVWFAQDAPYMPTLHVRSRPSAAGNTIAAVREEFDRIDKGFPVFNVKTLDARIDDSLAAERMVAASFGVLAATLAAVGLYGVLAYSVSRRTREIGIRMALGSGSGTILAMVAREAGLLVGAGIIAGAGIVVAAARMLSQVLPPTASLAPSMLAAGAGVMLVSTILAACVPAIRACRVDPLAALRHE